MAAAAMRGASSVVGRATSASGLHTSAINQKTGFYKVTQMGDLPLTYEQANPPYRIGVTKAWNTWNASTSSSNIVNCSSCIYSLPSIPFPPPHKFAIINFVGANQLQNTRVLYIYIYIYYHTRDYECWMAQY